MAAGTIKPRSSCLSDAKQAYEKFFEDWPPFCEDNFGSGAFGRWTADSRGDPAYAYTMDQQSDPRAVYNVSDGTATDHWHLVGNDRVVATAHNGGYVQLFDWSRGGKILNRWDPAEGHYSGGFKFIRSNGGTWNTLWEHLPADTVQERLFGVGYFQKTTRSGGLVVTERIEAPPGDDPVLISTTEIRNVGSAAQEISVVEFWDVNLHQLLISPVMTHGLKKPTEWARKQFNRKFVYDAAFDESARILRVDILLKSPAGAPGPDKAAYADYHPASAFLTPLADEPAAFMTDRGLFFSGGNLSDPPGAGGAADGSIVSGMSAYDGKAMLGFRSTRRLLPGESYQTRYIYGYAEKEHIDDLVARHRENRLSTRRPALEFIAPDAPWLSRELVWHSYYLQANAIYQDYFKTHVIDQGAAYSNLQGLVGAHRDFALSTLPLIYLRPDLARESLIFSMRSQGAETGALPYAHVGFGKVTGAGIHGRSSDLDLFFLWAMSEYLGATRDFDFLDEVVPFYPPDAGKAGSVYEHIVAAYDHLINSVGVGEHGMIKCGSGDWNDVLIAFSQRPRATTRQGESALNAGLATVALPTLADAIREAHPDFAERLREIAHGQADALQALWTGRWLARGYLGYGGRVLGDNRIFLDAQSFPVIGGVWDSRQTRVLFDNIHESCVEPQKAGALSLWPPMQGLFLEPGSDTDGGAWAAIDSWTAWAWSAVDPGLAWKFFLNTTLAARAQVYPDIWYGIWSGPDSYNADYHERPGETFNYAVTPMTDFPVMNSNRHAAPLTDAIKLAGFRHKDGAIVIDPRLPYDEFAVRLPLIGAAYLRDRHRGYYMPVADGVFSFAVRPPADLDPARAKIEADGREISSVVRDGLICFDLEGRTGDRLTWEIKE